MVDLEIGDLIPQTKTIPRLQSSSRSSQETETWQWKVPLSTTPRARQDAQGCDPGGPTLGVCYPEPQAPCSAPL